VASINQSVIGRVFVKSQEFTSCVLLITLVNRGSQPSVATNWELKGRVPGRKEVTAIPNQTPELTLAETPNTPFRRDEDAIFVKAAHPVPSGGMIQGYFAGLLPREFRDLAVQGCDLTISFKDVRGRIVHTHTGLGELQSGLAYMPLITPRPRERDRG
jgi:hypothetical protein